MVMATPPPNMAQPLLVIIGMLVSLGLVRFSGFSKMRSEMEGA